MADPRIVSLIPSATEIVAQLGLGQYLVGRSHECDFPAQVQALPVCTEPNFEPVGSSAEIHQRVSDLLQSALSIYKIKTDILAQLQPTHIVTQAQCEVCAVSLSEVEAAVAELTQVKAQIISLQPATLADVWADMRRVAEQISPEKNEKEKLAEAAIAPLQARVQTCRQRFASLTHPPTVACIEWTDPLMGAGNWIPELVTLAGGRALFGEVGQHSDWLSWPDLLAANPDVIIVMPCGYDLTQTRQATQALCQNSSWPKLQAVQQGRVYLTDGNQYFNRPGPRLVDSLEILAEVLHPNLTQPRYKTVGWEPFVSAEITADSALP